MAKFLDTIGYTKAVNYRDKILYVLLLLIIFVTGVFLTIYFIYAPFFPAILVHIIYISSSILMYVFLKLRRYIFVRYFLIVSHLIQLTLAVYVWFPVDTGFGIFYFMIPVASYLVMDYGDIKQRVFAIISSLIAAVLYLFSEILVLDGYLYQTDNKLNILLRTLSIISILIPMIFIFTKFAKDLYKTQSELEFLANTDTLTKIRNRRSFYDLGEDEFAVAKTKKYNFEFTMILMDIDCFKQINDTYGHPAGDDVLRQFAEIVTHNIRKEDTFSRYGGDEFAMLLHKTSQDSGYAIVEKLMNIVRDNRFNIEENSISITISIGLVQYSERFSNFDHMMKAADNALYEAKNNGRNQIVVSK